MLAIDNFELLLQCILACHILGEAWSRRDSTQREAHSHETPQTWQREWEKPDLARLVTPGSLFIPGQPQLWLPHARNG